MIAPELLPTMKHTPDPFQLDEPSKFSFSECGGEEETWPNVTQVSEVPT